MQIRYHVWTHVNISDRIVSYRIVHWGSHLPAGDELVNGTWNSSELLCVRAHKETTNKGLKSPKQDLIRPTSREIEILILIH